MKGLDSNADELVQAHGFPFEEHSAETPDGFILGLHRIPGPRNSRGDGGYGGVDSPRSGQRRAKPVVLIMHGFLQSSEAWLARNKWELGLPYILAEAGYDVWLGNNRGNKYSHKHRSLLPHQEQFWNYSLDELIAYDVPTMINYVLKHTGVETLSYVGFSQGSAQGFGAFSSNHALASKINLFVALAPATKVEKLHNPLVDAFVRAKPELLFLIFGRKSLLSSTMFWRKILPRKDWVWLLDAANNFLFGWSSASLDPAEKYLLYSHIYSFSSVKTTVHWFQIHRSKTFQMFDDTHLPMIPSHYRSTFVPRYQLTQMETPVALFYGGADTLPNFDAILNDVKPVYSLKEEAYEHLCFMWARDAHRRIFPHILRLLAQYNPNPHNSSPVASPEPSDT